MKTSVSFLLTAAAGLLLGGFTAESRADILYVSNVNDGTIEKITSDGTGSIFATGLGNPEGIAFDNAGNLYVADVNTIDRFTPDGVGSVFASAHASALAFDNAGNLYAEMNINGGRIDRFAPNGASGTFVFNTGVNFPSGLAFDSAGNLYAIDLGGLKILKYTPNRMRSVFATATSNHPAGLAFDSTGNLFVTESNMIEKFTSGGVGSAFGGYFLAPSGAAFDSAGNLYVADINTIERITPDGGTSYFATISGTGSMHYFAFTDDNGVPLPLANGYPTPEPTSAALLGLGALLLTARRRRFSPR